MSQAKPNPQGIPKMSELTSRFQLLRPRIFISNYDQPYHPKSRLLKRGCCNQTHRPRTRTRSPGRLPQRKMPDVSAHGISSLLEHLAKELTEPLHKYEQIWSSKSPFFRSTEAYSAPLERVLCTKANLLYQCPRERACFSRFKLLFVRQAIDVARAARMVPIKGRSLRARDVKADAYQSLAASCGAGVQYLQRLRLQSNSYLYLLQLAGPGDLLELGDGNATQLVKAFSNCAY